MAKKKRKKSSTKRRRRAAPKRRRRRRNPSPRAASPRRRRRRRRNPTLGKWGSIDVGQPFGDLIWTAIGFMAASFGAMRWGGGTPAPAQWPTGSGAPYSPTAGAGWTMRGYAAAGVATYLASEIVSRWKGKSEGQAVYNAGMRLIQMKFFYTQIVSRNSWLQTHLGQAGANVGPAMLYGDDPYGNYAAEVTQDDDGNVWLRTGDDMEVAMQGTDLAALVEEGPLGSGMGALVEAGALGEYLPSGATTKAEDTWARYEDTASTDPYQAAYM